MWNVHARMHGASNYDDPGHLAVVPGPSHTGQRWFPDLYSPRVSARNPAKDRAGMSTASQNIQLDDVCWETAPAHAYSAHSGNTPSADRAMNRRALMDDRPARQLTTGHR